MKDQSIYTCWLTAFRTLTESHGSQAKIAQLTGVTAKYINDIIAERRGASLKLQERIASALGLTYENMLAIGRSNSEQQTQHLVALAENAKQLIEINGINMMGKKTVSHIVIMYDNSIEYIGSLLDSDLPSRANELTQISQEYLGYSREISSIDGTKKYLTFGKEMTLQESLEFVQNQGGDLLGELEKYVKATGITLRREPGLYEDGDDLHSLMKTIEDLQCGAIRGEIRSSMENIYLPETIALTEAIDRLLRKNSQFKRSELTMLILSFLKQQGLPEDPQ